MLPNPFCDETTFYIYFVIVVVATIILCTLLARYLHKNYSTTTRPHRVWRKSLSLSVEDEGIIKQFNGAIYLLVLDEKSTLIWIPAKKGLCIIDENM